MNRLRELREDRDEVLDHVAAVFDVHPTTISKYELGQRSLTGEWIIKFARYYGVTADYILGLSDYPHRVVSNSDTNLLRAYDAATPEIREIVDHALAPYAAAEKKGKAV